MKNNFKKVLKGLGLVALASTGFVVDAMAQNTGFAGIVNGATTQFQGVTSLIGTISYIAGIGFGFKAILKFKEHNESKGQVPLSNAIVLFVVAGCLLGLPTIISASTSTVLGSAANKTGIASTSLQSIQ
jgi:hypothetical protein